MQEHDDLITGIALTMDKDKLITSSYDRSLVVLEQETLKLVSRVSEAHTDLIHSLDTSLFNANLVASAGQDGQALLWDLRQLQDSDSSPICKLLNHIWHVRNLALLF